MAQKDRWTYSANRLGLHRRAAPWSSRLARRPPGDNPLELVRASGQKYPRADVDPNPIFVRDGNVYTSAGVTAGMDLALALVEEDHGSRLALQVARNLVLYLRRPGGQSQFSAALSMQLTDRKPLRELEAWVLDNLDKPLNVPMLAERVAMSPRNFARVFTKEMKTTPAKFVERLRVEAARRRLEESQNSMETIAGECGFGNVNSMRNVFQRALKIAPGHYRRHFRSTGRVKRRSKARRSGKTRIQLKEMISLVERPVGNKQHVIWQMTKGVRRGIRPGRTQLFLSRFLRQISRK